MNDVDRQRWLLPLSAKFTKANVTDDKPEHANEDNDTDADGPDDSVGNLHHGDR